MPAEHGPVSKFSDLRSEIDRVHSFSDLDIEDTVELTTARSVLKVRLRATSAILKTEPDVGSYPTIGRSSL